MSQSTSPEIVELDDDVLRTELATHAEIDRVFGELWDLHDAEIVKLQAEIASAGSRTPW
jgi:hypothetical protein